MTTKEIGNKYSGNKVDVLFFQPVRKEGAWLFSNALLQLASFLHLHGFKAKVVHLGINQNYKETVKEAVLKYNPRFLAVGLRWFPNVYIALQAIRVAKTINKKEYFRTVAIPLNSPIASAAMLKTTRSKPSADPDSFIPRNRSDRIHNK